MDHKHTQIPVIIDRSKHVVSRKNIAPEALRVLYRLNEEGYDAYLAGGGVRDLLLHRKPKDFDVATSAHPNEVRKVFRNCRIIGRRFRLAHVFFRDITIEVSTFRSNAPVSIEGAPQGDHFATKDGVITRDNVFGTPVEDAFRRDFTVNALFYNIADYSIIDYVNGLKDLDDRVLRVIGDPTLRFIEDPIRMIRALRFTAMLGFTIEAEAWDALKKLKDNLALASPSRLYEEVRKLMFCGNSEKVFQYMEESGVLGVLIPELGACLHGPGGEKVRTWLHKALRQLDKWRQAGLDPGEAILWALLLGGYHELAAEKHLGEGVKGPMALQMAVRRHVASLTKNILIPKRIIEEMVHITAVQPLFHTLEGVRAQRFSQRPYFHHAFIYFKLASRIHGWDPQLMAKWERLLGHTE